MSLSHMSQWRINLRTVKLLFFKYPNLTISTYYNIQNQKHSHDCFSILPSIEFTGYRYLSKWAGSFPFTKEEMATRFAAREVLVLATEDDCSSRSNSENREGIDGAICAYRGKTKCSMEGLEDIGAVGEAIPGPGSCNIYTRRISWVTEDELQE